MLKLRSRILRKAQRVHVSQLIYLTSAAKLVEQNQLPVHRLSETTFWYITANWKLLKLFVRVIIIIILCAAALMLILREQPAGP